MTEAVSSGRTERVRNLTGERFGRLTVVCRDGSIGTLAAWHVRCDCGVTKRLSGSDLRRGRSRSCGCLASDLSRERATHGHATGGRVTAEYQAWTSMHQRCSDPSDASWARYGGRGIAVCERWIDFASFLADVGKRPSPEHSIDRKNNDGDYEPENVQWATNEEQANNRRTNRLVTHDGVTMTMARWARRVGMRPGTLKHRLELGWAPARALTTPVGPARRGAS